MIDLRSVLPGRLKEVFRGETQEATAKKLSTVQGTISKWLSGEVIPPTEMILLIAEAYKVSVDWLFGLSEEKRVNGIAYDKITYEQAIRIIDQMLEKGTIEHPDMNSFEVEIEESDATEDEEPVEKEPRYDSDYLKVNDLALSHMLRRRMKVIALEDDYYTLWRGKQGIFEGIKLLKYDERMREAIETKPWFKYDDADWKATLQEFESMTEEELGEYIEKSREDEKK